MAGNFKRAHKCNNRDRDAFGVPVTRGKWARCVLWSTMNYPHETGAPSLDQGQLPPVIMMLSDLT